MHTHTTQRGGRGEGKGKRGEGEITENEAMFHNGGEKWSIGIIT